MATNWEAAQGMTFADYKHRQCQIADVADEIKRNWIKWQEIVDGDCEFGARVAAILADRDDDKLGRIADLQYQYMQRAAVHAVDSGIWYGQIGDLKRVAGLCRAA